MQTTSKACIGLQDGRGYRVSVLRAGASPQNGQGFSLYLDSIWCWNPISHTSGSLYHLKTVSPALTGTPVPIVTKWLPSHSIVP